MNTNDELRAMLNEREVNWDYGITGAATTKFRANGVDLTFMSMRDGLVCTTILTPAQAIAATLGRDRLAFLEEKVRLQSDYIIKLTKEYDALFAQSCEAATRHAGQIDAMQRKLEAATRGSETCEADETDLIPFVRADSGDFDVDYIHVMECSACGGTYEHVNGSYEFCPRCGKVVDR